MPGNTVKINKSDDMNWYVGDSKMPGLLDYLKEHGFKCESVCAEGGGKD